ncbi:dihydrodipicolinate synthase family protein [Sediminicola luteus]|uniref:Dihydrodipicolinate synthase family protein n=1 Tax=Sediminicola luteus TaxID=319238 RepID=A0A2A4G8H4_9FLAO|nr:dihydrodipicolinate synthase family protein [Sediminicola luteus]PCE64723.1 hypothetical protein B7P33_06010 [Sediminicola luteus]
MELPVQGIIPPMITPLLPDGKLDVQGLSNLIEHMITGGVHGIFALGTNGEGPSLSYGLRKELIQESARIIAKRVPLLVGITDTSEKGCLEIAHAAAQSGADALVLAPPYYMPISQAEMVGYLERLVPKLPLPYLIYNMPSCTKLHLDLATVKKAQELGAIGIKDSSGDMGYLYNLIDTFKNEPDFAIITGTELFLGETIHNGGHGAVAGGANFFPKLYVALYDAARANDNEKISLLREKVLEVYHTIYNIGENSSRFTVGTKCVLSILGICDDTMASPLKAFNGTDKKKMESYVALFNEYH